MAPAPSASSRAIERPEGAAAQTIVASQPWSAGTTLCAAPPGGRSIALEDALGAGAIAEAALRLDPSLQPTDAAIFARDALLAAAAGLRPAARAGPGTPPRERPRLTHAGGG